MTTTEDRPETTPPTARNKGRIVVITIIVIATISLVVGLMVSLTSSQKGAPSTGTAPAATGAPSSSPSNSASSPATPAPDHSIHAAQSVSNVGTGLNQSSTPADVARVIINEFWSTSQLYDANGSPLHRNGWTGLPLLGSSPDFFIEPAPTAAACATAPLTPPFPGAPDHNVADFTCRVTFGDQVVTVHVGVIQRDDMWEASGDVAS